MLPLSVEPFDLHPQNLCDALPPAEVQGGVDRIPTIEGGAVSDAMALRHLDQPQEARRRVVVGCATPVLCRTGVLVACAWPACCEKGRG